MTDGQKILALMSCHFEPICSYVGSQCTNFRPIPRQSHKVEGVWSPGTRFLLDAFLAIEATKKLNESLSTLSVVMVPHDGTPLPQRLQREKLPLISLLLAVGG